MRRGGASSADERWLTVVAESGTKAARQARLVLRSKGIDYPADVRAAVVVWGGARRDLTPVRSVAGVDVVRGDHLLEWLRQWDTDD